ncbi:MAG: DUF835 domain-containing protein, partial [Thermoplasmatota archaeon]
MAGNGQSGPDEDQSIIASRKPMIRKGGYFWVDVEDDTVQELGTRLSPLIDEKNGYVILGRSASSHSKWGRKGLLEIGAVGEHQKAGDDHFGRKVFLDAAFPHIIFICGKRGSGKSYTLGIMAEELIRSAIGVGVVIIDPIGIFWSLKVENSSGSEKKALGRWGLTETSFPEVKVLSPSTSEDELPSNCDGLFSIAVGEMTAEDWCQVFDMDRFKTQGLLVGSALDLVSNGYQTLLDDVEVSIPGKGQSYSVADIIQCIETSITLTSKTGGFNQQTRRSLIARFRSASTWGLFSTEGTPLRELTSPNRVTVLDISDPNLGDSKRSLVTGIVARKILEGRIYSARVEERDDYDENDPDLIPLTWLLIDEAHVILPHGRQTPATEALIEYAKQGRRPGCALVLATQRPASTSDEILSQVDMLIGHNLALEDDMTALRRRVPAKLPQEYAVSDFIRAIPVGTALIADQKTQQRSFLIKVRPRLSHHAGSSAMPKAFIDRSQRKTVPLTASYSSKGSRSDGGMVRIPKDPGKKEEDAVTTKKSHKPPEEGIAPPFDDLPWGSAILIKSKDREKLYEICAKIKGARGALLFTRSHPSIFQNRTGLELKSFWLSSTPASGVIPPHGLQDISLETEAAIGEEENNILIIDGLEYLYNNNDQESVQKLMEILHEKVILGKHLMVIRLDPVLETNKMEGLKDVDLVIEAVFEDIDIKIDVFKKLDEIRPVLQPWKSGAQSVDRILSGDVVMSTCYNSRIARARNEGISIDLLWDGAVYAVDSWAILDGSP